MDANGTITFKVEDTSADRFVEHFSSHYKNLILRPRSARGRIATSGLLGRFADLRYTINMSSGGFDILPTADEGLILFTLPETGGMLLETTSGQLATGLNEAVASVSGKVRSYGFPEARRHTNLAFDLETLRARLATIFETPVREPLVFETVMPIEPSRLAPLAWLVRGLASPDLAPLGSMAAATTFSHLVQDMLLELWPHNHGHLFERRLAAPSRPQVQAAINYIHDHAHEAPSTVVVAEASGVSLRTLQQAFREATGKTISEYSRDVRLQKAKEDVLTRSDASLADIARRWGFLNVGRFSHQFLEAFGELPSHMRRR